MPAKRGSSRGRLNSRQKIDKGPMVRVAVWTCVMGALITAIFMFGLGVERLFFSKNPHFTLREIDVQIKKGNLDRRSIEKQLGLVRREQNLYALDLGKLRSELLKDPIIEEARVIRVLPDRIQVTVSGRTPVAQLLTRGGKTVDANGYVMPPGRNNAIRSLPIIIGIRGVKDASFGSKLEDPMLPHALQFLELKDTVTGGNMLDVIRIVCNQQYKELNVHLHGSARHYIRDGATLSLPADQLEKQLLKCLASLEVRALANQSTGQIIGIHQRIYITP